MIEGNKVLFGYGDICVSLDRDRSTIKFEQLKVPVSVAGKIPENADMVNSVVLATKTIRDLYFLQAMLVEVMKPESDKIITFKDVILDFQNFNWKSVYIVYRCVCENLSWSSFISGNICLIGGYRVAGMGSPNYYYEGEIALDSVLDQRLYVKRDTDNV